MKYDIHEDFKGLTAIKPTVATFPLMLMNFAIKSMSKKYNKKLGIVYDKIIYNDNGKKVKLNIFNRDAKKVMLYIHGGGFVLNGAPHHYIFANKYANELPCKVVFVDYKLLSKKHKLDEIIDECMSAYNYIRQNITKDKIIIAGDSAGGYLALKMALRLPKDEIEKLMLLYPLVDEQMRSESNKIYTDTPMWNSTLSKKVSKKIYDPKKPTPDTLGECEQIKDFPYTHIETCEFDCLHDDGIMLYNILKGKNLNCSLYETYGTLHGYDMIINSEITKKAVEERLSFLKEKTNKN